MVTMHDVEKRSSSRLRVVLIAVAIGLLAFGVLAAFGMWQVGLILGIAVVVGSLTPPFSKWPKRQ